MYILSFLALICSSQTDCFIIGRNWHFKYLNEIQLWPLLFLILCDTFGDEECYFRVWYCGSWNRFCNPGLFKAQQSEKQCRSFIWSSLIVTPLNCHLFWRWPWCREAMNICRCTKKFLKLHKSTFVTFSAFGVWVFDLFVHLHIMRKRPGQALPYSPGSPRHGAWLVWLCFQL